MATPGVATNSGQCRIACELSRKPPRRAWVTSPSSMIQRATLESSIYAMGVAVSAIKRNDKQTPRTDRLATKNGAKFTDSGEPLFSL